MSSHRLARLIVGTLPRRMRAERSEEIVGTLLDAGEDSRIAFMREAASVLGAGVRGRVRQAVAQPAGAVMRDALTWAALVIVARMLVIELWVTLRGGALHDTLQLLVTCGSVAILACFTLRLMRFTRGLGVLWAVALLVYATRFSGDGFWVHVPPLGLALVGFAAMGGEMRRSTLARAAWIVPAGLLALADFAVIPGDPLIAGLALELSALLLAAFVPACALGIALAWTSIAMSTLLFDGAVGASTIVVCLELIAGLPIILLARVVAQRFAGRSSPV